MYGTQYSQAIPPQAPDPDSSHFLQLRCASDLSENRELGFATGEVNRQITLLGDPVLDDWFDQGVKSTAQPSFAGLRLERGAPGPGLGVLNILTDADAAVDASHRFIDMTGHMGRGNVAIPILFDVTKLNDGGTLDSTPNNMFLFRGRLNDSDAAHTGTTNLTCMDFDATFSPGNHAGRKVVTLFDLTCGLPATDQNKSHVLTGLRINQPAGVVLSDDSYAISGLEIVNTGLIVADADGEIASFANLTIGAEAQKLSGTFAAFYNIHIKAGSDDNGSAASAWSIHNAATLNNFFKGSLLIGATTGFIEANTGNDLQVEGFIECREKLTIGGDLNHDGTRVGFFGTAPSLRAPAYTTTQVTADRSFNADATSVAELADVLGTLIADLKSYGLLL